LKSHVTIKSSESPLGGAQAKAGISGPTGADSVVDNLESQPSCVSSKANIDSCGACVLAHVRDRLARCTIELGALDGGRLVFDGDSEVNLEIGLTARQVGELLECHTESGVGCELEIEHAKLVPEGAVHLSHDVPEMVQLGGNRVSRVEFRS
jgi:hypothetical protein